MDNIGIQSDNLNLTEDGMKSAVKKVSNRGGKRSGAGRDALYSKPLISTSLSLRPEDRKLLAQVGKVDGTASLSAGARIVIEAYRARRKLLAQVKAKKPVGAVAGVSNGKAPAK